MPDFTQLAQDFNIYMESLQESKKGSKKRKIPAKPSAPASLVPTETPESAILFITKSACPECGKQESFITNYGIQFRIHRGGKSRRPLKVGEESLFNSFLAAKLVDAEITEFPVKLCLDCFIKQQESLGYVPSI